MPDTLKSKTLLRIGGPRASVNPARVALSSSYWGDEFNVTLRATDERGRRVSVTLSREDALALAALANRAGRGEGRHPLPGCSKTGEVR